MHLVYPLSLFALAGIAIPLIIHLWNIKQGKTLKIGSIALLGKSSSLSAKSYKITDWWLFVLRTLLVILLTLLLAQPVLKKAFGKESQKGWVLFEKSQFPSIWKNNRTTIDSLMKKGYELHDFDLGFQKVNLSDTLAPDVAPNKNVLNYTALLSELNSELQNEFPVYLFSSHHLNKMGAELPPVSLNLKWMEIKPADTVGNWITKVANKTYESQSTPSSTSYKLLNENENVSTISALINEGNNAADAAYIKAALEAIGVFSGRSVKIKTWNNNAGFKSDAGLIFWLSDQPISRALIANLRPGTRLISYEPGKVIPIQSVIDLQTEGIGNDPVITLSKRIDAKNTPGQAIWTDGFGKPILSLESSGKIKHYHLYVKFNPQWTDLVWSEQFVKAIMPIVLSEQEETGSFGIEDHPRDQRVWNKNLQTTRYQPKSGTTAELTTTQPLNPGIWILALLVFITERILSLREKKEVKNA